jgi:NADH-quinone oxidoreductase subunit M
LIIIGAFKANIWIGALAATTMISAMLYIFWMLQRTVFGPAGSHTEMFADLDGREMGMLIPLVLLLLITGIAPSLFIPYFEPQIQSALANVMQAIGGIQ